MEVVPVSIVIPSYNGRRFVKQITDCLKPYYDLGYEILLVEDGSNDGAKEDFLEIFPKATYVWQENAGVCTARYTGAVKAKGEYIQFIDIDDTIEQGKLEKQYHAAKQNGLDVVYSGWREAFKKQDSEEVTYRDWILNDSHEDVATAIFNRWWFPFHATLVNREAFLAVDGGDKSLRFIEDFGLWLKLFSHGYKFGYCDGGSASYFKHENSNSLTTNRKSERWWEDTCKVFIDALTKLDESGDLNESQKKSGLRRIFVSNRNLAKFNRKKAFDNWNYIRSMNPDFTPVNESKLFTICFRILGYKGAEIVAQIVNTLRSVFFNKDSKDNIQGGDVYIAHSRKTMN